MNRTSLCCILSMWGLLQLTTATPATAQPSATQLAAAVPSDVQEMYDRGLQFVISQQSDQGDWPDQQHRGAGVTGLALMALLASGEDPNFGLYAANVRRATAHLIRQQDAETGYFGNSMYHHGFATLALSEAYGAVDDRDLATVNASGEPAAAGRSIGQALELAVRASITAQQRNPLGAWRYSPTSTDADTSVSGAVLVGLLAARNAGIEVPDQSIDRALQYFQRMTGPNGQVTYANSTGGFSDTLARTSICALVHAVAGRKDPPQYDAALGYLTQNLDQQSVDYPSYTRYYQSQALFQGDVRAWEKWNASLIGELKRLQQPDGRFTGKLGPVVDTSLSLLALALNYRLLPIYERH